MSEPIQIQGLGPLTQPHSEPPFHKGLKAGTIVSCLATVLTAQFLAGDCLDILVARYRPRYRLGLASGKSKRKPTIDKQDFGFSLHVARPDRLGLRCSNDWLLCGALLVGELVSANNITLLRVSGSPSNL